MDSSATEYRMSTPHCHYVGVTKGFSTHIQGVATAYASGDVHVLSQMLGFTAGYLSSIQTKLHQHGKASVDNRARNGIKAALLHRKQVAAGKCTSPFDFAYYAKPETLNKGKTDLDALFEVAAILTVEMKSPGRDMAYRQLMPGPSDKLYASWLDRGPQRKKSTHVCIIEPCWKAVLTAAACYAPAVQKEVTALLHPYWVPLWEACLQAAAAKRPQPQTQSPPEPEPETEPPVGRLLGDAALTQVEAYIQQYTAGVIKQMVESNVNNRHELERVVTEAVEGLTYKLDEVLAGMKVLEAKIDQVKVVVEAVRRKVDPPPVVIQS